MRTRGAVVIGDWGYEMDINWECPVIRSEAEVSADNHDFSRVIQAHVLLPHQEILRPKLGN